MAVDDLDSDGATDVITASYDSVSVLKGQAASGHGSATLKPALKPAAVYPVGGDYGTNTQLAVGDVNGDSSKDLVVTSPHSFAVLLGSGGRFGSPVRFRAGADQVLGLAVGDFKADGLIDIAVATWDDHGNNDFVNVIYGRGCP